MNRETFGCTMRQVSIFSKPVHLVFLIACALMFSSCTGGVKGRSLDELAAKNKSEPEYEVNPGDTLRLEVRREPELTRDDYYVRPKDGKFTMPLIGDVPAANKTLKLLTEEVTEKLRSYLQDPWVTISVVQTAPIRFYLNGKFVKPGEYRSDGEITLLQAIATGGGFAPFADESSIILIRRTTSEEIRYKLDYNQVEAGREPNPILKDGDVVSAK